MKFVLVPIDKASTSVAITCKKYYAEVILRKTGVIGDGNNIYSKTGKCCEEIIEDNSDYWVSK